MKPKFRVYKFNKKLRLVSVDYPITQEIKDLLFQFVYENGQIPNLYTNQIIEAGIVDLKILN